MKPNPIPFALPDQEKRELQQMIDVGIIEETDIPCSAPVIFIKKTRQFETSWSGNLVR